MLQNKVLVQYLGGAFLRIYAKQDDKVTAFYTGLPSYTILMSMFKYTTKILQESTSGNKLSNFQCFLLTLVLMSLSLKDSNFPTLIWVFRICIHVKTASRILTKWLQLMDIRLTVLIQWPERRRIQATMPWRCRPHYGLLGPPSLIALSSSSKSQWTSCPRQQRGPPTSTTMVKYLISITPQGAVNFISKGYAGI